MKSEQTKEITNRAAEQLVATLQAECSEELTAQGNRAIPSL